MSRWLSHRSQKTQLDESDHSIDIVMSYPKSTRGQDNEHIAAPHPGSSRSADKDTILQALTMINEGVKAQSTTINGLRSLIIQIIEDLTQVKATAPINRATELDGVAEKIDAILNRLNFATRAKIPETPVRDLENSPNLLQALAIIQNRIKSQSMTIYRLEQLVLQGAEELARLEDILHNHQLIIPNGSSSVYTTMDNGRDEQGWPAGLKPLDIPRLRQAKRSARQQV